MVDMDTHGYNKNHIWLDGGVHTVKFSRMEIWLGYYWDMRELFSVGYYIININSLKVLVRISLCLQNEILAVVDFWAIPVYPYHGIIASQREMLSLCSLSIDKQECESLREKWIHLRAFWDILYLWQTSPAGVPSLHGNFPFEKSRVLPGLKHSQKNKKKEGTCKQPKSSSEQSASVVLYDCPLTVFKCKREVLQEKTADP